MRKPFLIGWKDLKIILHDRTALILMLAAPFALTLGMGFVSGRFSRNANTSGLSEVPVVVVNQDRGPLGAALEQVFTSDDLSALVEPRTAAGAANARQQVDAGEAAAAVIIPLGFSESLIPSGPGSATGAPASIEVYVNPERPVGAGVVQSVVESFLAQVETGRVSAQVAVQELLAHGLLSPDQAAQAGLEIGTRSVDAGAPLVSVEGSGPASASTPQVDVLAYFAPAMAVLFLMYTVTQGGRSILAERREGTLARLLTTPTHAAQVLGGKVLGIFLTGAAQVAILVGGTSLLFGLRWGDPLAVAVVIVAAAAAATGWGIVLAALARTPAQVGSVGTAMMLLFGMLGGTFMPTAGFPAWLKAVSRLTPNAWAIDAFSDLSSGGTLAAVLAPVAALLVMAAALFAVAVLASRRASLARA